MTQDTKAAMSDLGGCQIEATLQLFDGKWKGVILHHLLKDEVLRFNELVKRLPSITHRMLSKQLRDMEVAGLVARTVYPVVPPRVDYSLTPLGRSLEPQDMPTVRALVRDAAQQDYRFSSIVLGIANTEQFRKNRTEVSGSANGTTVAMSDTN